MKRKGGFARPSAGITMKSALLLFVLGAVTAGAAERPNILWITSEDNSAWFSGCYGNPQAHTPHMDRLAREGIRYTHAYANAPVCAAARTTWITGVCAVSLGTQNMRSRYAIPPSIRFYPELLREAGYFCSNNSKTDYNIAGNDKRVWDECSRQAHYRHRKPGQPFFAIFNLGTSHESKIFHDPKPGDPGEGPTPDEVFIPPYHPDLPGVRKDWATYHQRVSAMDLQVGKLLDELEREGLADDTIVAYCGDHGGVLPRSKRFLYETGTQVPFIVRIPKKWRKWAPSGPGTTCDRMVGFIDMPPTWLALCGVKKPAWMQGSVFLGPHPDPAPDYQFLFRNRMDERDDFVRAIRDQRYRYMRIFLPHRPDGQTLWYPFQSKSWRQWYAAWRAGKCNDVQSAFWEPRPTEMLFDVEADPWEIHNLADDPAYADRLARMRALCLKEMRAKRDTGCIPEAMYPELRGHRTLMEYVRSDAYPFERVLNLALLASDQKPENLPALRKALTDSHPVIRYWGAVGCSILGPRAAPALADLRRCLANDASPVNRITAAEAVGRAGHRAEAIAAIKKELAAAQTDMLALHALEALDQLGPGARLTKDELAAVLAKPNMSYSKRLAPRVGIREMPVPADVRR